MPMHMNTDHLVELFYSESQLFDLEGKLFFRAESKQSSARHYQKCLCRLRGNLLLIADISSTISIADLSICLVILNNFEIKLCEESKHDEFCIHLNKSAQFVEKYYFICNSRGERDKWIESIYLASFNFLSSIYKAIRDDFNKRQENEIITKSFSQSDCGSVQSNIYNQLNRFILIKCDNLLFAPTIDPFVYVKVFYRKLYIDQYWQYLGSTEIIQSKSPQFNCAINLPLHKHSLFELKFELYNVLEREFDTSYLAAFSYYKFNKEFECNHNYYKLRIFTSDNSQLKGSLSFTVLCNNFQTKLKKSLSLEEIPLRKKSFAKLKSANSQVKGSLPNLVMNPENEFRANNNDGHFNAFNNAISKKFSFKAHSNSSDLIIEEFMAESKFVFLIPQILMKLYAQDEDKIISMLEQFYRDNSSLQTNFFEPALQFHQRILRLIKESLGQIIHFMSRHSFRSSKLKKESFLQFIPVNFHKQSCRTFDATRVSSFTVFSTGAYACHHLGYDRCGMKSILTAKNEYPKVIDCWTMLKKLFSVLHCESRIIDNLDQIDNTASDTLDLNIIEPLYKVICTLSEKLGDLISIHEVDELLSYLNVLSTGKINIFDDEFQLEPIELVYLNIKACLVAINYRISQKQISKSDFDSCNRKLKGAIESLRKIVFACYISLFSQLSKEQVDSLYKLRFRHLSLHTQAMTTLIIFIMDRIGQNNFLQQIYRTRYILIQHETLLSCYSDELGMLEDMSYALEEVANTVSVLFTFDDEHDRPQTLMPDIDTFGDKIRFIFHLNKSLSENGISNFECKVMSLIFNIGVNEQATLAEKLGYNSFQHDLNEVNFHKLKAFVTQFYSNNLKTASLINQLKFEINRSTSKNIRILQLVQEIVREVNGVRVTCCKSAKDRTGMSITLEEVRFFFDFFHLSEDKNGQLFQTMLDTLRRDGVRIENAFKNIGTRKYAFNRIQLVTFPSKFKPPSGTYSTLET